MARFPVWTQRSILVLNRGFSGRCQSMDEKKSKSVVNRGLPGMWWRAKASWCKNSIELQADGAHPRHDGAAVPPMTASPCDQDEHAVRLNATVYFGA